MCEKLTVAQLVKKSPTFIQNLSFNFTDYENNVLLKIVAEGQINLSICFNLNSLVYSVKNILKISAFLLCGKLIITFGKIGTVITTHCAVTWQW